MDKKKVLVKVREQGSYVGEVVKPMDKKKVLVKVMEQGSYVDEVIKSMDKMKVLVKVREQGSYVGEVEKPMDKKKVLVKVIVMYRTTVNWLFSLGENFAKMLAIPFTWGLFSRYFTYFLHKVL